MSLDTSVLVLNRLWQAVNVVNARRALTLVYVGRGKVVSEDFATYCWDGWAQRSASLPDEERPVGGVSFRVGVPSVIQLLEYDRVPRPRVKFTRANVYLRDRNQCQYCGRKGDVRDLTLDHVNPRSRGGRTTWRNIVVSCMGCNARKGNRLPEEAGMNLMRAPRQPSWHPATSLRPAENAAPEWLPFLGWGAGLPGVAT